MNDYLKSNKAFQLAMETLKSESRYNVGMIEAKEEGFEEGYQKGFEEGYKKGFEEGYQKGIEEWNNKVILNMNKMGIKIEFIAEVFNISVDEVKKILNM